MSFQVPHWVRGSESATMLEPRVYDIALLGLGASVGTPQEGNIYGQTKCHPHTHLHTHPHPIRLLLKNLCTIADEILSRR